MGDILAREMETWCVIVVGSILEHYVSRQNVLAQVKCVAIIYIYIYIYILYVLYALDILYILHIVHIVYILCIVYILYSINQCC